MGEYRVLTYDTTSDGCKKLTKALGGRMIRPSNSEYRYRPQDIIINWGLYGERGYNINVNPHSSILTCTSKTRSYEAFKRNRVPCPEWTRDAREALKWITQNYKVYARYADSGCKGEGIVVCKTERELLNNAHALFFTKGIDHAREFRVYTAFGVVLGIREKIAPQNPSPQLNWDVRASDEWLYSQRDAVQIPQLRVAAVAAAKAIGLDFSGTDIGVTTEGKVVVFECNSAPWLSECLAEKLADAIQAKFPLEDD